MKVIYVTANCETVQTHLVQALQLHGAQAEMFYHINRTRRLESLNDIQRVNLSYRCPIWSKGPVFYLTRLYLAACNLVKQHRKTPPDILHGNMLFADGCICRYAAKKFKIPYIVSVRDTDMHLMFLWKLPWLKRLGIKNLQYASRVVFLGAAYREELLARLNPALAAQIRDKSVIIPNGIDKYYLEHLFKKQTVPCDPIKLIMVGKVGPRKNPEAVIAAMELLKTRGTRTEFTVVGPIEVESYRSLVTGREDIHYLGKLPKEEVCKEYRKADIFVVPSHTETFGLVYAEAMSQGLPVIYTRGQGFDGQFPNGQIGYAVSDKDPAEIADRIAAIIENYKEISDNCVAGAHRFDWGRIAQELIQVYCNAK